MPVSVPLPPTDVGDGLVGGPESKRVGEFSFASPTKPFPALGGTGRGGGAGWRGPQGRRPTLVQTLRGPRHPLPTPPVRPRPVGVESAEDPRGVTAAVLGSVRVAEEVPEAGGGRRTSDDGRVDPLPLFCGSRPHVERTLPDESRSFQSQVVPQGLRGHSRSRSGT